MAKIITNFGNERFEGTSEEFRQVLKTKLNEEIKLFLAKGSWVNYVHYYYFQDTLGENFEHLSDLEIKDRLEFFTDHINKGLSLNKKDWINYLIDQGWSKDEEDVNDTWFNLKETEDE